MAKASEHPPTPNPGGAATDPAEVMLNQTLKIVTGARRISYGKPEDNFACIGDLWTTYLRHRQRVQINDHQGPQVTITAGDVAAMMILMKTARLAETPNHADSWRDTAGYAACGVRATGADLSVGAP